MHEMDNTKRVLTIIGLVFEGISVVLIGLVLLFFTNIENLPGMDVELAAMTAEEHDFTMWIFNLMINVMGLSIFILGIILIINLYLFTKLMKGRYSEEQAKKVYLYQAIWGGINLLSNQIVGILYLVSGVGGYNGHKEETDIRSGI